MDLDPAEDQGASVRPDDAPTGKRGPGRPKKQEETAETVDVHVQMLRAVQVTPRTKTKKGEARTIKLSEAREWVAKGFCAWADPRPDL